MADYNFIGVHQLPVMDEPGENTTVVVETDGRSARLPIGSMKGSGGSPVVIEVEYADLIQTYEECYAYILPDDEYDGLIAQIRQSGSVGVCIVSPSGTSLESYGVNVVFARPYYSYGDAYGSSIGLIPEDIILSIPFYQYNSRYAEFEINIMSERVADIVV